MKKIYFEKIAVFDLDGTLWAENSHIDILNKYYQTQRFTSLAFKIINRFFPTLAIEYLFNEFSKIPETFIENYSPTFIKHTLHLIDEIKQQGYHILIVSNAPEQIVKNAALRLDLPYICSDIGRKYFALKSKFEFDTLFVCTDNKSDVDLLFNAQKKVIYTQRSTSGFFRRKFNDATFIKKESVQ